MAEHALLLHQHHLFVLTTMANTQSTTALILKITHTEAPPVPANPHAPCQTPLQMTALTLKDHTRAHTHRGLSPSRKSLRTNDSSQPRHLHRSFTAAPATSLSKNQPQQQQSQSQQQEAEKDESAPRFVSFSSMNERKRGGAEGEMQNMGDIQNMGEGVRMEGLQRSGSKAPRLTFDGNVFHAVPDQPGEYR